MYQVPEEYFIQECVSTGNATSKLATVNQRMCVGQKFRVLAEAFDIITHETSTDKL
jgi:hypothetical protein